MLSNFGGKPRIREIQKSAPRKICREVRVDLSGQKSGYASREAAVSRLMKHILLVIAVSGTVYFLNLGVPDLWDEDEPKNAACAREMLERNDWVVPMFNYELRTAKPVLLYWLMMSAYTLFGVNEFSARFWSAVLGVGTCLLTYGIGRRLYQPSVGLWAATMLAASLMFGVSSRAATPDAPLIFASTLALAIFVWGLPTASLSPPGTAERSGGTDPGASGLRVALQTVVPQQYRTYVMMYAAMGLGVLAKGPVGVVLPTLILMGYVWSRGSLLFLQQGTANGQFQDLAAGRSWLMFLRQLVSELSPGRVFQVGWVLRPLTALVMVAAVALPWYIWVGWRTDGAWIEGFLGKHNVSRFVQPLEGHSGPVFYYVLAVLIGFFPWSVFLPLAMVEGLKRNCRPGNYQPADAFCLNWAVIYIGFFSLASTKLPSYVLTAYPALALITASWLQRWLAAPQETPRWLMRGGFLNLALVGGIFLIAVPLAVWRYVPGLWYLGWTGMILVAGGVLACVEFERHRFSRAATTFAIASLLFTTSLFGIVAVQVNPWQTSSQLLRTIRQRSPQVQIAAFDYFEPSLAFYSKQRVQRLKTIEQARMFLRESPDGYLLTREKHWNLLQNEMQGDASLLSRRRRFLKSGEVLLVTTESRNLASSHRTSTSGKEDPTVVMPASQRSPSSTDRTAAVPESTVQR